MDRSNERVPVWIREVERAAEEALASEEPPQLTTALEGAIEALDAEGQFPAVNQEFGRLRMSRLLTIQKRLLRFELDSTVRMVVDLTIDVLEQYENAHRHKDGAFGEAERSALAVIEVLKAVDLGISAVRYCLDQAKSWPWDYRITIEQLAEPLASYIPASRDKPNASLVLQTARLALLSAIAGAFDGSVCVGGMSSVAHGVELAVECETGLTYGLADEGGDFEEYLPNEDDSGEGQYIRNNSTAYNAMEDAVSMAWKAQIGDLKMALDAVREQGLSKAVDVWMPERKIDVEDDELPF